MYRYEQTLLSDSLICLGHTNAQATLSSWTTNTNGGLTTPPTVVGGGRGVSTMRVISPSRQGPDKVDDIVVLGEQAFDFIGSPPILINGKDLEPGVRRHIMGIAESTHNDEPFEFPPTEMIRKALHF